MFPFDLSTINILLMAAVVALFIFFITVLIKLNPSIEKKENFETQIKVESKKLLHTSPIEPRNPPPAKIDVSGVAEKPPAPTHSENKEISKPEKTVASAKTESASSKRDCLHQFGYLRTFPKNAPIPDECFGCPKIVECLINEKNSKKRI